MSTKIQKLRIHKSVEKHLGNSERLIRSPCYSWDIIKQLSDMIMIVWGLANEGTEHNLRNKQFAIGTQTED